MERRARTPSDWLLVRSHPAVKEIENPIPGGSRLAYERVRAMGGWRPEVAMGSPPSLPSKTLLSRDAEAPHVHQYLPAPRMTHSGSSACVDAQLRVAFAVSRQSAVHSRLEPDREHQSTIFLIDYVHRHASRSGESR